MRGFSAPSRVRVRLAGESVKAPKRYRVRVPPRSIIGSAALGVGSGYARSVQVDQLAAEVSGAREGPEPDQPDQYEEPVGGARKPFKAHQNRAGHGEAEEEPHGDLSRLGVLLERRR